MIVKTVHRRRATERLSHRGEIVYIGHDDDVHLHNAADASSTSPAPAERHARLANLQSDANRVHWQVGDITKTTWLPLSYLIQCFFFWFFFWFLLASTLVLRSQVESKSRSYCILLKLYHCVISYNAPPTTTTTTFTDTTNIILLLNY